MEFAHPQSLEAEFCPMALVGYLSWGGLTLPALIIFWGGTTFLVLKMRQGQTKSLAPGCPSVTPKMCSLLSMGNQGDTLWVGPLVSCLGAVAIRCPSFLSTVLLSPAFGSTGDRYIVADCGGGTVDLTVHQIEQPQGTLKELYKASGETPTPPLHARAAEVPASCCFFHSGGWPIRE